MAYNVTSKDASSISTLEAAFGTTRFLPALSEIPPEYFHGDNLYVQVVTAIFYDHPLPDLHMLLAPDLEASPLNLIIRAHLRSCEPAHEHKIAGVAFLLSRLVEITPPDATVH